MDENRLPTEGEVSLRSDDGDGVTAFDASTPAQASRPPLRPAVRATSSSVGGGRPPSASEPVRMRLVGRATSHSKRLAKALRRDPTDAEAKLWYELRRAKLKGTRFRRQVPIGRYVADFACHRAKLVVETDGASHSYDHQIARDTDRTAELERAGFRIVRFTNDDVCSEVIATIIAHANELREATRHPSFPHRGGGVRKADGGGDTMFPTPL